MSDSEEKDKIQLDNFDDIDIELSESNVVEPEMRQRPKCFWLGRKIENTKIVGCFSADTVIDIWQHCMPIKNREIGGILVGKVYCDNGNYVLVSGTIAAKEAKEKAASLTFTHNSWTHILNEKDSKYPDLDIVGWYHTHPGYGIFLSGMDRHIHNNFFKLPHQIALVIDTVTSQFGIFQWNQNQTEKINGLLFYGDDNQIQRVRNLVKSYPKNAPLRSKYENSVHFANLKKVTDIQEKKRLYGDKIPPELSKEIDNVLQSWKEFSRLVESVHSKLNNYMNIPIDLKEKSDIDKHSDADHIDEKV